MSTSDSRSEREQAIAFLDLVIDHQTIEYSVWQENMKAVRALLALPSDGREPWRAHVPVTNEQHDVAAGLIAGFCERCRQPWPCQYSPEAAPGPSEPSPPAWRVPCPVCEGRGELREAVQAWDVAGAPIPECPHCDDGMLDLQLLLAAASEPSPEVWGDLVTLVIRIRDNIDRLGHQYVESSALYEDLDRAVVLARKHVGGKEGA